MSTTGTDADWVVKLVDVNPGIVRAVHRVYRSAAHPSSLEVSVLPAVDE